MKNDRRGGKKEYMDWRDFRKGAVSVKTWVHTSVGIPDGVPVWLAAQRATKDGAGHKHVDRDLPHRYTDLLAHT